MNVRSILVVDDDPNTLEAMRRILEPHGYVVSMAASGLAAIQALSREIVHLVITDVLMPNGDGLELTHHLRKNLTNTRVIAMSAGGLVDAEDYLLMARGFGVDGVLRKPFTSEQLLAAIKSIESRSFVSLPPFKV